MKYDKANKESCKNMIDKLNVSDDIKKTLEKIRSVASSENDHMKATVKDLFISSSACKELTNIAKCYENIITSNNVYPVRGSKTYLELAFPASLNEKDYIDFFASPRIVAEIQNDFTGVFLVSFEQWKAAGDLIGSEVWQSLVKFVLDNKTNISFVFHVTPEFKDGKLLFDELSKHTNMFYLEHAVPNIDQASSFVVSRLSKSGMDLSEPAKDEIGNMITEKFANVSEGCRDYKALEQFCANVSFELYYLCAGTTASGKEKFVVEAGDIKEISKAIKVPKEASNKRSVGFR